MDAMPGLCSTQASSILAMANIRCMKDYHEEVLQPMASPPIHIRVKERSEPGGGCH